MMDLRYVWGFVEFGTLLRAPHFTANRAGAGAISLFGLDLLVFVSFFGSFARHSARLEGEGRGLRSTIYTRRGSLWHSVG